MIFIEGSSDRYHNIQIKVGNFMHKGELFILPKIFPQNQVDKYDFIGLLVRDILRQYIQVGVTEFMHIIEYSILMKISAANIR